MFSVFLVFGRQRVRAGDAKPHEKPENIVLLDYWVPDAQSNQSPDDRLQAEGLPKTARLAEFCFARKKVVDDAAGLVPPALSFVFTLTSSNGERTHCYCLRSHRPEESASHRLDVGGTWIEASVFVSKNPFHRLFPAALNICRVRRTLDRPSHLQFLQQLHRGLTPTPSGGPTESSGATKTISIDSPCMNVACKYEFSTSREPKLDCLFDMTNPQMLHYVLGAILLERRVCLVAKHEKRLSDAAYALTTLACSEAPLKGYCHNFVPILPGTMLELGLGNPAPYVVGILRSHLKATDSIKELGDIVIVDLDSKVVKISPGGAPILPLGLDTAAEGLTQTKKSDANEQLNPWMDVCGPFGRDLAAAYSSRDVDALVVAVRAVILIVTVGRIGQHLDDPAIRLFNGAFRKTQIAAAASPANDSAIAMMLGQRGYSALRAQLSAQQVNISAGDRQTISQAKAAVMELTAVSGKGRPDLVTKATADIAKRSFDCWAHIEGTQVAIRSRLADSAGRNWKHAYKSLALLNLLVRAGSELVVSECWDELATIFELTRYSLNGTVGVPSRVVDLVQRRAVELYELVVDLHALRFARSANGHVMIQRAVRQRMQQSVPKLSISKDLKSLLEAAAPSPIVEPDAETGGPEEDILTGNMQPRVTSTSGMGRPPPPPPSAKAAPPPPPPPPPQPSSQVQHQQSESILLDFNSFTQPDSADPPMTSLSDSNLLFSLPPTSPIPMAAGSTFASHNYPNFPGPLGGALLAGSRADNKLMTAFDPKPGAARADNKLVTAFDVTQQGLAARARRPKTNELVDPEGSGADPASSNNNAITAPPRPARAAPTRPDASKFPTTEAVNAPSSPIATGAVTSPSNIKSRYPPPGVAPAKPSSPPGTINGASSQPASIRPRGPPPPGIKGPSNTGV